MDARDVVHPEEASREEVRVPHALLIHPPASQQEHMSVLCRATRLTLASREGCGGTVPQDNELKMYLLSDSAWPNNVRGNLGARSICTSLAAVCICSRPTIYVACLPCTGNYYPRGTRIYQVKVTIIMTSDWSRTSTFFVCDKRIA